VLVRGEVVLEFSICDGRKPASDVPGNRMPCSMPGPSPMRQRRSIGVVLAGKGDAGVSRRRNRDDRGRWWSS
jgi:hypothetical protein